MFKQTLKVMGVVLLMAGVAPSLGTGVQVQAQDTATTKVSVAFFAPKDYFYHGLSFEGSLVGRASLQSNPLEQQESTIIYEGQDLDEPIHIKINTKGLNYELGNASVTYQYYYQETELNQDKPKNPIQQLGVNLLDDAQYTLEESGNILNLYLHQVPSFNIVETDFFMGDVYLEFTLDLPGKNKQASQQLSLTLTHTNGDVEAQWFTNIDSSHLILAE